MVLKCKMCGGDLDITAAENVCECEYCGTKQTVPAADSEKKLNLFNRAHRLRFKNEFDKAEAIYESIISEFPEEAEAYWGICLCRYGIEYVDDPKTGAKIPTCHRTSFKSIFEDDNYKQALENADVVAQKVYRDEARAIDALQKDILSVVNTAEPYDVFICYKETGEDGQRTPDSVLAQDIYDGLTAKGLRVFFARITLEDKLGTQYEPYIFAALNSAKVMLVVGTKYEHLNAVWVKNEWSRYLDFIRTDRSRVLIPCYKGMDPYDLPEEFGGIQAQDMSKIGALQDLVRGVMKLVQPAAPTAAPAAAAAKIGSNTDNLVKRGYLALEESRWEDANSFFERVLDEDAECGEAYWGKFLAENRIKSEAEFDKDVIYDFDSSVPFTRAMKYSSADLQEKLKAIYGRNARRIAQKDREAQEDKYQKALQLKNRAATAGEFSEAEKQFKALADYKDSAALAKECEEAVQACLNQYEQEYLSAVAILEGISYGKNTDKTIAEDKQKIEKALQIFTALGDYKDSHNKVGACRNAASKKDIQSEVKKQRGNFFISILIVFVSVVVFFFSAIIYPERVNDSTRVLYVISLVGISCGIAFFLFFFYRTIASGAKWVHNKGRFKRG